MKYLTALIFLFSCQKYNATLISWHGYYITDTVNASSMAEAKASLYDCPGDIRIYADTVLAYTGEPENIPATWREIQPEKMVYLKYGTDVWVIEISPGIWQRKYFTYQYKN